MRCGRCGAEDPVAYRRAGSAKTGEPLCLNERDLSKSCWHIDKAGGRMPDVVDRLEASQGTWESDDGFGHDWVPSEIVLEAAHEIRSLRERVATVEAGGSPEVRELDALRRSNADVLARLTEAARELGGVAEDLGGAVYQAVCNDTLKAVAIAAGLDWTVESTVVLEGLGARIAELSAEVEALRAERRAWAAAAAGRGGGGASSRGAVGRMGHSEAVTVVGAGGATLVPVTGEPGVRVISSVPLPADPKYRLGDSDGTTIFEWDSGALSDVLRRAAGVDPGAPLDGEVAAAWALCESLERRLGGIDVGPDLRTGDRVLVVDLFGSFFHALRATLVNAAARRETERRGRSDG